MYGARGQGTVAGVRLSSVICLVGIQVLGLRGWGKEQSRSRTSGASILSANHTANGAGEYIG